MIEIIIFLFSLTAFFISVYLVCGIWYRGKRSPYLNLYFIMGFLHSVWVLLNGINLLLSEHYYRQIYPLVMVMVCVLPSIMLRYMLHFTESKYAQSRLVARVLTILPVFDLLLLLTNPWHQEYITGYDGIRPLSGRLFPIHAFISYIPILILVIVLARYIIKNIQKTPSLIYVGLGVLIPLLFNILYTFNVFDLGFDITPYVFLIMFIVFTIYSIRFRLFDVNETAMLGLFTSLSDATLVVDNAGLITAVNPVFKSTFSDIKISTDKTSIKDVAEFLEQKALKKKPDDVFSILCSPIADIHNAEITLSIKGIFYHYSVSKNIIMGRGQYAGFVVVLTDISNYRQMITEINEKNVRLVELKEIAEEASIEKSEFLSSISHEIRTPMNVIMGFSELISYDSTISAQTREYIDGIKTSADSLLEIVNGIMDISQLEAGKMMLEEIPFNLFEILKECETISSPKTAKKGINLHFYAEPSISKYILGDPAKLRQILLNLLSNAIKFTDTGLIKIVVEIREVDKDTITLNFAIRDSGIGMTPEEIQKVFKPFVQADNTTTRKYEGVGIGLSITKSMLELMGSELTVESRPGKGSKFSFDIRFKMCDNVGEGVKARTANLRKPVFTGCVLVCEDNKTNQFVIREHLTKIGLDTVIAENGKVGVELAQARLAEGKPFDIIFMDIHMPVMDGLEAAKKLVEIGNKAPVVALTANVVQYNEETYRKHGIMVCIGKPFKARELWDCLLEYLTPVGMVAVNDV